MDNILLLTAAGFIIGSFGTLIGAGGGFILVPLLILANKGMSPTIITAISIAVVAANAISGSVAYSRAKRIDYRAGLLFGLFTIPGSIGGVFLTKYIPLHLFNICFGVLLLVLGVYLFLKSKMDKMDKAGAIGGPRLQFQTITDRQGRVYTYSYNQVYGIMISIVVGFLSPLLGIGGGIIHVPAMINWLRFPVFIATATSHFILAIMATASVMMHIIQGSYSDPHILKIVIWLCIGVIPGAQLGAFISHKIETTVIVKVLAICLALVGLRILL
ncbi:MAG: sulfite exporter TauE/SafE family protein [Bacteroidota bacterium]